MVEEKLPGHEAPTSYTGFEYFRQARWLFRGDEFPRDFHAAKFVKDGAEDADFGGYGRRVGVRSEGDRLHKGDVNVLAPVKLHKRI